MLRPVSARLLNAATSRSTALGVRHFRHSLLLRTGPTGPVPPSSSTTSTTPPPPPPPPPAAPPRRPGFITRLVSPYTSTFRHHPIASLFAFVSVHPTLFVGFTAAAWSVFHYFDYAPLGLVPDFVVARGLGFIDTLANWTGYGAGWRVQERGRWVMQAVAAYGVVKVMLPLRLAVSVAATPWVAKWSYIPMWNFIRRKKKTAAKPQSVDNKL